MGRLEGKIAVVTGAGNGIGRATAELFAREGARVYVTDLDGDAADGVANGLKAEGHNVEAMAVDVARAQYVSALFQRIETQDGRIDILINNAGLNVREDFRHLSDEDWVKIREVNLDGVVRLARDGFALLRAGENASLVNIASIMGHKGMRQLAAYSATKGAVAALTRALAVEYAPFGIRVNGLAPGFIETNLTKRVLRNPAINKALIDKTPLRRFGEGADVAEAALFLSSDAAKFITGTEIAVDGGMAAAL
ncbi:MAG: SDR family NAD(P)-dependent oxidoreductase [Hyphomicrobiaceae bacterium]